MGYLHIDNLYKNQDILLFKECYALEKIHGTSAHVSWDPGLLEGDESVKFFSGGEKHERFVALFDEAALRETFLEKLDTPTVFFGEAYGGKQQGMSKTYGPELKFIVFDVKIGNCWLSVPQAQGLAESCGFEFVAYMQGDTTLEWLDMQRDLPSVQATRNGVKGEHIREGVVLRPLIEVRTNNGSRIIAKHKRPEFRERKSIPEVDPAKRELLENAEAIATEWVTPMRLTHVLDKLRLSELDMKHTPEVIKAMVEDVTREGGGLIVDTKPVRKAIGQAAVKLYKKRVVGALREENI